MIESFQFFHSILIDPERIPVAIIALLVSFIAGLVVGPWSGNAHPFYWFLLDLFFGRLGDKLNKKQRPKADLIFRGFMMTVLCLGLALFIGRILSETIYFYDRYRVIEIFVLTLLLSSGAIMHAIGKLYLALEKKDLVKGAYFTIARSLRRDLKQSDDFGITRGGFGLMAYCFDKALVAPIFWYLIGGLPAMLISSTLSALAWRFGQYGHTKGFGAVPLALEKLMNFIPSLLAGILMILASLFTPTAKIFAGVASIMGYKNRAKYEEGSFPLSALAWSLKISLGGPHKDVNGHTIANGWVGPEGSTAKLNHHHLRRGLYIFLMAFFLLLVTLGGAYVWANLSEASFPEFF